MKLLRIAALAASALLTLGLAAGPASAATKTVVSSSYACVKHAVSQNANGTWNYNELCTLAATVTGPVKSWKVTITAPKTEVLTLDYQTVGVTVATAGNGGAMGMSQPVTIHGPYTLPGGVVRSGYKMVGAWMVQAPLAGARPLVAVTATR